MKENTMGGNRTVLVGIPLGLWLLCAPFVVYEAMFASNFWNDMVVGVTVLFLSAYGLVCSWRNRRVSVAAGGLLGLLGLWQVTRPFVAPTAGPLPLWGDAVVGVLLAALGGRVMRNARNASLPEQAQTSRR
ncbi:SPW repeat-containing protein [Haladaptatus litoreus]|uniref:SPW repeat-containing protein n=1 Tax=Haladaptatus litoreus TaxID=553468 RepID=A0A1N7DWQ8_9EURY|nr:SPW repeat protein [Haladaptatus litoreus]SIR80155.1 SPW repeat-containing protein [Haladaptatus litoreus]